MTKVYFFFFATFLACWLLVKFVPGLNSIMTRFAQNLGTRAFPSTSGFEYNKFALLRIAFGLILIIRGAHVYDLMLASERFSVVGLWASAELIAGAMLVLGLLSQWALLFLVGAMWQYGDVIVLKSTLGNDIGAMLAVLLFTVNAGKYLSLDAVLIRRTPILHIPFLYYRGAPKADVIFYAKFAAIISYWALCVYSLAVHFNEPAWMDGSAGPLLLGNNFMSRWHDYFNALFSSSELAVALAKSSLWLMLLWYPTILPFVLIGGLFRRYIIVWGWLFFAMSLFILQLGYLAEIEIVLWLALFWSFAGMDKHQALEVLYDDRCQLCDKTVQAISVLDIFGRITLRPLSQNKPLLDEIGLDMSKALTDLYGIRSRDRTLYQGYEFYIRLAYTLVLLWPLLPILLLGRFLRIGPKLYRYIADRRTQIFGVCELPGTKFLHTADVASTSTSFPHAVALHVTLLSVFYFAAIPAPYIGWSGLTNMGANAAHIYGIAPINVFNKGDLRMAENWFVLNSIDFNELVPVFAPDGSRLQMHASDRIYFGHTVSVRRTAIGIEGCHYEEKKAKFEYLSKIYLQQRKAAAGDYRFDYAQYYQPLVSPDDIARNQYKSLDKRIVCVADYIIKYPN